jgi:hypothetical protein
MFGTWQLVPASRSRLRRSPEPGRRLFPEACFCFLDKLAVQFCAPCILVARSGVGRGVRGQLAIDLLSPQQLYVVSQAFHAPYLPQVHDNSTKRAHFSQALIFLFAIAYETIFSVLAGLDLIRQKNQESWKWPRLSPKPAKRKSPCRLGDRAVSGKGSWRGTHELAFKADDTLTSAEARNLIVRKN